MTIRTTLSFHLINLERSNVIFFTRFYFLLKICFLKFGLRINLSSSASVCFVYDGSHPVRLWMAFVLRIQLDFLCFSNFVISHILSSFQLVNCSIHFHDAFNVSFRKIYLISNCCVVAPSTFHKTIQKKTQ